MNKQAALEAIFRKLRAGDMPEADIRALQAALTVSDTTWLMEHVESLAGPQAFMDELDEYDDNDNATSAVIADGFFKHIDMISALIMSMGDEAIAITRQFEHSQSHYAPWVIRYCSDSRFASGVKEHFAYLLA